MPTTAPTAKCQIVLDDFSKHVFYKFDLESEHKTFTVSSPGCYLRVLAVGGGGNVPYNESGAGSGHVTYVSEVPVTHSRTYQVSVGDRGQTSSIDGILSTKASPGQDSSYGHGGGGYSGG